ncbi:hypothetical protein C1646_669669 [Rhizophagus diaphanus]|nr:hypothetical protein C1646_669669 [Rhizophagus diaphanus] [Rhizophagus sp. MUCL 43196]
MEQLENEGYLCIYVTLVAVNIKSEELFWSSFGDYLARNAAQKRIKSKSDFTELFLPSGWGSSTFIGCIPLITSRLKIKGLSCRNDYPSPMQGENTPMYFSPQKLAKFLTAKGVLTEDADSEIFRISSWTDATMSYSKNSN